MTDDSGYCVQRPTVDSVCKPRFRQGDCLFRRLFAKCLDTTPKAVLSEIDAISPVLADLYDILQKDEIDLIDDTLVLFRDGAWDFATVLSLTPGLLDPAAIGARDLEVAAFSGAIRNPPKLLGSLIAGIAAREDRDVVHDIQVLDGIASEALA